MALVDLFNQSHRAEAGTLIKTGLDSGRVRNKRLTLAAEDVYIGEQCKHCLKVRLLAHNGSRQRYGRQILSGHEQDKGVHLRCMNMHRCTGRSIQKAEGHT